MLHETSVATGSSAGSPASQLTLDQRFSPYQRLTVRQQKRWLEILTRFEAKNTYDVFDEQGQARLRVREQGKGFWSFVRRMFLGPARPFRAHVTDVQSGELLLDLVRPFRFIHHCLEVRTGDGRLLGTIQKKWTWFKRLYHVQSDADHTLAELYGPMFKPWTFEIRVQERQVGLIQKKWSGLAKEMFTDADNFGVTLADIKDARLKLLAFAAIVLIDVVHFERKK